MRTPTTKRNRAARIGEAMDSLVPGPEVEQGFSFVAALVSPSLFARTLAGVPTFAIVSLVVVFSGWLPGGWTGLVTLAVLWALWAWFRFRRMSIVGVSDQRVLVLRVSPITYRPIAVLLNDIRPGPGFTLGRFVCFDTWFKIRTAGGEALDLVTGWQPLRTVRWSAAMMNDGILGVDAVAGYDAKEDPPPAGAQRFPSLRPVARVGAFVILFLYPLVVAVIERLYLRRVPWSVTGALFVSSWAFAFVLLHWGQRGARARGQRDGVLGVAGSIAILSFVVALVAFRLASGGPEPLVAVGTMEGDVVVAGAPCRNDLFESLSIVRPADPSAGRPDDEVLWSISDPTPTRDFYVFPVGGQVADGYALDRPLDGPLPSDEPLEALVTTSATSRSLPFQVQDLEDGTFSTSEGPRTETEVFTLAQRISASPGC